MVAEHLGDYAAARDLYEESLARYRNLENGDGLAESLLRLGDLARLEGHYDQAVNFYSEAFQLSYRLEIHLQFASALHKLGQVAIYKKNAEEAEKLFLNSLKIQRKSGNKQGIAECLGGLASMELLQGKLERAAKLFGAARAILEAIGAPLAPADRFAWERGEECLRAQITHDELELAWKTGKMNPLEKILDEVMDSQ